MTEEASPNCVVLPPELIDEILEHAPKGMDAPSLSSMALVSHSFRIQANKERFSTIILNSHHNSCERTNHRIRCLRNLIDAQTPGPMMGAVSFITSFEVRLVQEKSVMPPALEDGSLATIFRKLFRTPELKAESTSGATLSIGLEDDGRETRAFDWRTLTADFVSAFLDVCRNSQLTGLCLIRIIYLPRGLLHGSNVKYLSLLLVDIDHNTHTDVFDLENGGQEVLLETLDTDGYHSLMKLNNLISHRYQYLPVVSHLKVLNIGILHWLAYRNAVKIIANALFLESVTVMVDLPFGYFVTDAPLEYGHLNQLNSLRIIHGRPGLKDLNEAVLDIICGTLGHSIPPSLHTLHFQFSTSIESPEGTAGEIFGAHKFSVLDNHLSHPSFHGIKRVILDLHCKVSGPRDFESFYIPRRRKDWAIYIRALFPFISSKKDLNFEVEAYYSL